ncbi:MAG: hypothetical protein R2747_13310 [Pyrinomonadaceae bacterium]
MRLRTQAALLILAIGIGGILVRGQKNTAENWRDVEPETVTLFSRIKYKDKYEGYGKAAFSFRHGLRSDVGREATRNNYELEYGNISFDGDNDWFLVTMVSDDRSRIKDLGEMNWSEIFDVPILQASVAPHRGIRGPSKAQTYEESSDGQVTKAAVGHMYVIHSKDGDSDLYTLLRVEKIVPGDEVTISWKAVPSPEK